MQHSGSEIKIVAKIFVKDVEVKSLNKIHTTKERHFFQKKKISTDGHGSANRCLNIVVK
jgi:ribosome-associated protein YbcJ (S4-like RNA binding protein)